MFKKSKGEIPNLISRRQYNNRRKLNAGLQQYVADQVKITRDKDDKNLFRQMTYRNDAEMKAVLG